MAQRTLAVLIAIINTSSVQAESHRAGFEKHAKLVGAALLEAQLLVPVGTWQRWVTAELNISLDRAKKYMRMAHGGNRSVLAAPQPQRFSRAHVHALARSGWTQAAIAADVGVSTTTIRLMLNPAARERSRQQTKAKAHAATARRIAARRAAETAERDARARTRGGRYPKARAALLEAEGHLHALILRAEDGDVRDALMRAESSTKIALTSLDKALREGLLVR